MLHGEEGQVWHSCVDWAGFLEEGAFDGNLKECFFF